MSQVPTEIIYKIFASFSSTIRTNDLQSFPWFLGHICSTWRSIFLSMTAEFWYTIRISIYGRSWAKSTWSHSNIEHSKRVLRFYLDRDPTAPFSFTFTVSSHTPREEQENVRQTLEMLIDESMRWEDASLRTSFANLLLLRRAQDHLPLLRKLDLDIPDLDKAIEVGLLNGEFSWTALEDLTWKYENIELLRQVIDPALYPSPSKDIMSLPHLTTLNCDHHLLQLIEAPALEDLSILCQPESYQRDIVLSFLRRSSSNIRHLHITKAEAATAIEIIRHTPQIMQLTFFDVADMELVLEQLTLSTAPGQDPLARHMSSLRIRAASMRHLNTLHPLILSRTSAPKNSGCERLQRLSLSTGLTNMRKTIILCEERGVELVWESTPWSGPGSFGHLLAHSLILGQITT